MELTRRFVFRGNASALGGQIYRPRTVIVDLSGASSLGVSGGRSQAQIPGRSFDEVIRFGSAFTSAQGLFDDEKRARDVSDHRGRVEQLASTTTVTAELRDLSVGVKPNPVLTIRRMRATLISKSPEGSGEPSIAPARDTVIQDVDINGYGLEVIINPALFRKHDTRAKLVAAADDPKFVRDSGHHLFMHTPVEGQVPPTRPRIPCAPAMLATIVREIKWTRKPMPGAKIDGHSVVVPEFGTVFFGEMFITAYERRLSLLRFDLGSPIGGWGDGVDVGSNGAWAP